MIGLGEESERKNREGKKGKGKKERRKREKGKEYDEAIVNPRNRRNRRNRPKQDSRRAPSVEELNTKRKKRGGGDLWRETKMRRRTEPKPVLYSCSSAAGVSRPA
jgi:hypothetical protein